MGCTLDQKDGCNIYLDLFDSFFHSNILLAYVVVI